MANKNGLGRRLAGSWSLFSFEAKKEKGKVGYPLGRDARSSIILSADGYISIQLSKSHQNILI
jgi:hypothetical protein